MTIKSTVLQITRLSLLLMIPLVTQFLVTNNLYILHLINLLKGIDNVKVWCGTNNLTKGDHIDDLNKIGGLQHSASITGKEDKEQRY